MDGDDDTNAVSRLISLVASLGGATVLPSEVRSTDGALWRWSDGERESLAVALAVPPADPGYIELRFAAQRAVAGPGIVAWRDLQQLPSGFVARCQRGPGTPLGPDTWSLDVARQLVVALGTWHAAGIVHAGLADVQITVHEGTAYLGPPALGAYGSEEEDWRALGERLSAMPSTEGALVRLVSALRTGASLTGDDWPALLANWLKQPVAIEDEPPRYDDFEPLGQGGMGVVVRARDRSLGRRVALKLLREGTVDAASFFAEARLTARLQHPGIVPVHDMGELQDGQPYYAMEEIRGRRLNAVLEEARRGSSERPPLIGLFARVCETVAFAHSRGVVHRDLKPANLMVGAFGDVRVVDWGVAATVGAVPRGAGTKGFAAPEQFDGGPVFPRLDVFALGVILSQILSVFGDDRSIEELTRLAQRCQASDPEARPVDAGKVADAVNAWLERRDQLVRANATYTEALTHEERAQKALARAAELRSRANGILEALETWSPIEDKRDAWALEQEAETHEAEAAVARARYEQGLNAALDHVPDHRASLDRLGELYQEQLVEAETQGRTQEAIRLHTVLEDLDGGRHRAWLRGDGAVTLVTDPPGAQVWLERYVERDRQLVPEPAGLLGTTPLHEVRLARGSWRLRIRHPDCDEVLYPVFVSRGEHWHGIPPGESEPLPILLPPRGGLSTHECYVPAGWFLSGGDRQAADPTPRRRLWVDSMIVRRFPVTVAEYVTVFLGSGSGSPVTEEWIPSLPESSGGSPLLERDSRLTNLGRWRRTDAATGPYHMDGDSPIVAVPWSAALAFAKSSRRPTRRWTLPRDAAWEKCARGVDGRAFPWGNHADEVFARCAGAQRGSYTRGAVNDHPTDCSPYGVRGLAGNVRDWCINAYQRTGEPGPRLSTGHEAAPKFRMLRGGSYTSELRQLRCCSRTALPAEWRAAMVGFRLVAPVEAFAVRPRRG